MNRAAMTFAQIGQELGISEQEALNAYARALRKLRRKRGALQLLSTLKQSLETARFERTGGVPCIS